MMMHVLLFDDFWTYKDIQSRCRANVCQFLFSYRNNSISSLARAVIKYIKRNSSTFTLVAYSFGCAVALEVIALLEAEGYFGRAIFIDGSVQQFKFQMNKTFPNQDEEIMKTQILIKILQTTSLVVSEQMEAVLASDKSIDEKIDYVLAKASIKEFSPQHLRDCYEVTCNRLRAIAEYEFSFNKLKSRVTVFRPKAPLGPIDDSAFSDLFENPVDIKVYDGDHENILKNINVANDINEFLLLQP